MSYHIVIQDETKFIFGWDQPLLTFYFQVYDLTRPEDEQITTWLGAMSDNSMYEVEELVSAAAKHGLHIGHGLQIQLYREKDNGI